MKKVSTEDLIEEYFFLREQEESFLRQFLNVKNLIADLNKELQKRTNLKEVLNERKISGIRKTKKSKE